MCQINSFKRGQNFGRKMSMKNTIYYMVGHAFLLILATGLAVVGQQPIPIEKDALLELQQFLASQKYNNRGVYIQWNRTLSPCTWRGISCDGNHVVTIDLSQNYNSDIMFYNFSAFRNLRYLDLSNNYIAHLSDDLNLCRSLQHLNLSRNVIQGQVNLTGMDKLEVLDLSSNRISGQPMLGDCKNLKVLDLSMNDLTGPLSNESSLGTCIKIQVLHLSSNRLSGNVPSWVFPESCSLNVLDLSENNLTGDVPKDILNCKEMMELNLGGNKFSGKIPDEIGLIYGLQALILGDNNFSREIPETLLRLSNLTVLDLSKNNFGNDIQEIFGEFTNLSYLILNGNSYTGGLYSSGILKLKNLSGLDLSDNNLSGPLPPEIAQILSLKVLVLSSNRFSGNIPLEYANLPRIQVLDLSFNELEGSIPACFGKLKSLLLLVLSNNSLSGSIPAELGDCSSLLWLNLSNNQLSGKIPGELAHIGKNASPTLMFNRVEKTKTTGLGDCSTLMRWMPKVSRGLLTSNTRMYCVQFWDIVQKGYGISSFCPRGSEVHAIPAYVLLSGNQLSGEIPSEIIHNSDLGYLNLSNNRLYGKLSIGIELFPYIKLLDISKNEFSGEIPNEIRNMPCLESLDLSYNNFSGNLPTGLTDLTNLAKFNISYNPLITGKVPSHGQLSTFDEWSYLGLPLFQFGKKWTPNEVVGSENSESSFGGRHVFFITFPIFFFWAFFYFSIYGDLPLALKSKFHQPTKHNYWKDVIYGMPGRSTMN